MERKKGDANIDPISDAKKAFYNADDETADGLRSIFEEFRNRKFFPTLWALYVKINRSDIDLKQFLFRIVKQTNAIFTGLSFYCCFIHIYMYLHVLLPCVVAS